MSYFDVHLRHRSQSSIIKYNSSIFFSTIQILVTRVPFHSHFLGIEYVLSFVRETHKGEKGKDISREYMRIKCFSCITLVTTCSVMRHWCATYLASLAVASRACTELELEWGSEASVKRQNPQSKVIYKIFCKKKLMRHSLWQSKECCYIA